MSAPLCDCERSHNGLGLGGRPCDCQEDVVARLIRERDTALEASLQMKVEWGDAPLPEDPEINAAHPLRSGNHARYQEAMRLVGACHSKGRLVALVNWLLARGEEKRR